MKAGIPATLVAALMVVSCASPYGQNTLIGGYKDTRIDDTHYQVRFDGNGNSSADRVWNFWIYRCAELTKQKGFAYFALQRPADKTSGIQRAEARLAAFHEGDDPPRMMPAKGGGASYVPIYIPGGRITTWHANAIVSMMNEPLPEDVAVLRAQTVLDELDPYVKSDGKTSPIARDELFSRAAVLRRSTPATGFSGTL
jgi:hypothetical protein